MEQTLQDRRLRVAAYCRVSTDSGNQHYSYDAQKAYYTQKIGENPDWELAGIFADVGVTSADMKRRQEFKRMITVCKRGQIDLILVKSISRFSRNVADCLEVIRMLKANGVRVIFEQENIDTFAEPGELMLPLYHYFALRECECISQNIVHPAPRRTVRL